MTSGVILTPLFPGKNSLGYSDPDGEYYYRKWSGNDRPVLPKQYTTKEIYWFERVKTPRRDSHGNVNAFLKPIVTVVRRSRVSKKRKWVATDSVADDEHSYDLSKTHYLNMKGTFTRPSGSPLTYECTPHWAFGQPTTSGPLWLPADDYKLIAKLREKIVGSDFNLAVFLAESGEALDMIGSNALRIADSIRLFSRGRFADALRSVGAVAQKTIRGDPRTRKGLRSHDVSGQWLELQYGWLPLMSDMKDGAEFLAHQFNVPKSKVFTASRKKGWAVIPSNSTVLEAYDVSKGLYVKRIKAIVEEVDIPGMLGLKDPASVIWEKLPYSFVCDWVLPIGSYLSARGTVQSLKATFVTTTYQHVSCRNAKLKPGYSHSQAAGYQYVQVALKREVSTSLAVPKPSVIPLGKAMSWRRCANALALLEQKRGTIARMFG